MKNFYDILGVKSSATPDEIKRAYRRLASQHHPDKGGDVKQFQEIEQAYRVLSDPQARAQYDNPQPQFSHFGFGPQPGNQGFDFDTIFDIFGARFGQQPPRQQIMRMSLWIQLSDVATGGKRTVSVSTGHGVNAVELEIPQGIEDGQSVQYSNVAPGGGDLIITFRIHPNPEFQRNGLNLIAEKTVSIWDLILGAQVPVRDIRGNQLSLTVPAKTQPGTMLRLKGRGLTHRHHEPGDLLVRIQAKIPENIPPELLSQIEQTRGQ